MCWRFEGPNRNPLRRSKDEDEISIEETEEASHFPLSPKIHRLVLSPLETILAATIISETIQKVGVIMAQLPRIEPKFVFEELAIRTSHPIRREVNFSENDVSNEQLLSTELANVDTLLRMIHEELITNEEPAALYFYNDLTNWNTCNEEYILKEHKQFSKQVFDIKEYIKDLEITNKAVIAGLDKSVAVMQAGYEESCSKATIMEIHSGVYRQTRVDQNDLKIKLSEREHKRMLHQKLKAIEDEHKANKLIVKYITQATEKHESELTDWSKKYYKDIEDVDLKIARNNQVIPDLVQNLADYLATYYERELEIADYVRIRDYRLKMDDIERFLVFMTTVIQAWWRGNLVRWEIGPYKYLGKLRKKPATVSKKRREKKKKIK